MYADRGGRRLNPVALGGALAINGGVIALMMTLGVGTQVGRIIDTFHARSIPADPPPPPPQPQPNTDHSAKPPIFTPQPKIDTHRQPTDMDTSTKPPEGPPPTSMGDGLGSDPPHFPPPPPLDPPKPPVLTGVQFDQRYAASFQPAYPSREQAEQTEGVVTLRVLVGTDGRVKDVIQVRATTSGFFEATKRQALKAWRFKPATRDGVAYAEWKEVTARFVMPRD